MRNVIERKWFGLSGLVMGLVFTTSAVWAGDPIIFVNFKSKMEQLPAKHVDRELVSSIENVSTPLPSSYVTLGVDRSRNRERMRRGSKNRRGKKNDWMLGESGTLEEENGKEVGFQKFDIEKDTIEGEEAGAGPSELRTTGLADRVEGRGTRTSRVPMHLKSPQERQKAREKQAVARAESGGYRERELETKEGDTQRGLHTSKELDLSSLFGQEQAAASQRTEAAPISLRTLFRPAGGASGRPRGEDVRAGNSGGATEIPGADLNGFQVEPLDLKADFALRPLAPGLRERGGASPLSRPDRGFDLHSGGAFEPAGRPVSAPDFRSLDNPSRGLSGEGSPTLLRQREPELRAVPPLDREFLPRGR